LLARALIATISTMRYLLCLVPLIAGCAPPAPEPEAPQNLPSTVLAGRLQNKAINEASGIARSQRQQGVYWIINDSGKARLHAVDGKGKKLGQVKLDDAKNVDWEDIASFSLDGTPYLLVADIGDNDSKRKDVTVYVVEEPETDQDEAEVAWSFDYSYPNGPRDAEALTVDIDNERILVLTKRDVPAVLYELPLRPATDKRQRARRLGAVRSLPQPSRQDAEFAPATKDWYWQPSGMDISADGQSAVILTYRAVYYYRRRADELWIDAFQTRPAPISAGDFSKAESVAFSPDGRSVYVTFEGRNAILLRVDLNEFAAPTPAVTIMTFNVQNLFDNIDDPEKDDKAYLPIEAKQSQAHISECNQIEVESWRNECLYLDWSDAAIDHKLGVLAETIKQVGDGRGADIIALQEVENVAILERLRTEHLTSSNYLPPILIEGQDTRGVDTAFLSKLPLASPAKLHPLALEDYLDRVGDTRGVLEATFELPDGSFLTGFSVHFPAPFHPTEMRELAFDHLNTIRSELPADRNVFAAGDFNTTSSEDRKQDMLERFVRPYWTVAHDACSNCPGTQYYARDDTWSFLDMVLFAPASKTAAAWQIVPGSVALANRSAAQVTDGGTPARYHSAEQLGVSDHWPLVVAIEPRP